MRWDAGEADRQVDVSRRRASCEAWRRGMNIRSRARQQLRPLTEVDSDTTVSGRGGSWGCKLILGVYLWPQIPREDTLVAKRV